jgi:hypothetical protein
MPEGFMKYSWIAIFALALCACGNKERAGTTSETENEVALRIVMPDGSAASSARVFLIDAEHYDAKVARGESSHLDSAIADSNGNVLLIYRGDSVQVSVLAQKTGYAAFAHELHDFNGTVTLGLAGRVEGKVNAPPGSRVILDETGLSAVVGVDGSYSLNNVPQGYFGVLVQVQGQEAIFSSAVSVDSSSQSLDIVELNGFLFEDFDDGDSRPLVAALNAGGSWYVYNDGAGTVFEPAGIDKLPLRSLIPMRGAGAHWGSK